MTLPPRPAAPEPSAEAPKEPDVNASTTPTTPTRNTAIVVGVIAAVLMLCLCGSCLVVAGAVTISGRLGTPEAGHTDAGGPIGAPPIEASPTETPTEDTPSPSMTTEDIPTPAVEIGQCIVVDEEGDYQGLGNCNGTRGTYRVLSVDRSEGDCADPEGPWITVDGYRLCLERHLVRNFCYKFPNGAGWIVGASKCGARGTVLIVDIVPGAANGDQCTREYRWNHWYQRTHPTVVYCVMQY